MASAAKLKGEDKEIVAVIGDGAMTAGMAYEALSHAGSIDENILVVLNEIRCPSLRMLEDLKII
ncbi:MAG: hypothetical protein CM1200mP12_11410 [Gammaproteobacteria bacterium]|nr:MAG: hypothetical protein CM1200mP12_11410 [Gammaproteobacteria bacterium]